MKLLMKTIQIMNLKKKKLKRNLKLIKKNLRPLLRKSLIRNSRKKI